MDELAGRVVIVTGAGRGLGREHALLMAQEGARVVVNDIGSSTSGEGSDPQPANETASEIRALGGECIAHSDSVAEWTGARSLINTAIEHFGDLHVLVNNAGILRDRMLANMSCEEWDSVIRVHLRGHFCPSRFAASYWRDRYKAGHREDRSLINTSSTSGLLGNVGQSNYGAAKAGIASMTIIADKELGRYGVRANAIAPAARTRLTEGLSSQVPDEGFDPGNPANIAPFVAYLATDSCDLHGHIYFIHGGKVQLMQPWALHDAISINDRWTIERLRDSCSQFADTRFPGIEALSDSTE